MRCVRCQVENREGRTATTTVLPETAEDRPPQPVQARVAPRGYTPKHLADKVLRTRSSLEGERRSVTPLAERLDPEEVHQIIDRCFDVITAEVHRFEGTVNQYTGDGVMALFGAPIAHEDTGVHDLLSSPVGGGMSGHPNLQDLPSLVVHHEEYVQRSEEDRPHPEEVARPDILGMVCQQRPPGGREDAVIGPPHVLGDGPGRHGESEPRELCLDTPLSPQAILDGHAPDQGPQGPLQGRPTTPPSWPGPPPPKGRPSPAMPAEHGVRLDDEERVAPCGEPPTDENPEPAVAVTEPWRHVPTAPVKARPAPPGPIEHARSHSP
jgi:hypothetical protein